MDIFKIGFENLQPSQLYINQFKLSHVAEWICHQDPNNVILPVLNVDGHITLTDGHSRALALYQLGVREFTVYWDTEDIDYIAYKKCVEWCQDESIYRINDLEFRVIRPEQFEKLWINRCTQMHSELGL